MIERNLAPVVLSCARQYPVVTVTGPRQSGKTTLCRALFPDKPYVSLEALDARAYATSDPRGFLEHYRQGAVFDEVQQVPELASYLQGAVDEDPTPGRFVLTGSQHFALSRTVSQSLAGRTAILHLLPPSLDELGRFPNPPASLLDVLWTGAYPRIHDRAIPADRWLADYVATYVQRDVRQLTNVTDLVAFTTFLRLVAGRTGQEVNLSALGADAGVSHNTARAWSSVLEASFLVQRLPPFHRNLRKRLVKAPKLHLLDTGLACHLIGIRAPEELRTHPLRGALFETWVAAEVLKARVHRGQEARLLHYRETRGVEVDLVVDGRVLGLVEAKSGQTVSGDWVAAARAAAARLGEGEAREVAAVVVYGGEREERRGEVAVVPWSEVAGRSWG